MSPPFLSYAQTGEDVLLWRALQDQQPGFYIDAGAADPSFLSVTRAFYERGWHGIDVEPLPEQAAKLRAARPRDLVVEAALAAAPGRATLYRVELHGDTGLSTLDEAGAHRFGADVGTLEVQVTTLASLCRAHVQGEVHFLKVDVEGAEASVLRGADFRVTRPWIVLVEATRPLTGEAAAEWEGLLLEADYRFVWFDGLNRFYVAAERHAHLARHFTVPPNPFDHYQVFDPAAEAERAALDALARSRLEQIGQLEAELRRPASTAPPIPVPPAPGKLQAALRPMAWRLRGFLLRPLQEEIATLRAQQDAILTRLDRPERDPPALAEAIERALLALVVKDDK